MKHQKYTVWYMKHQKHQKQMKHQEHNKHIKHQKDMKHKISETHVASKIKSPLLVWIFTIVDAIKLSCNIYYKH